MKKSKQLEDAYALRDLIADAIIDFESKHRARVVLHHEYEMDNSARARIGQLAVEIVAYGGNYKTTTYRSLRSE